MNKTEDETNLFLFLEDQFEDKCESNHEDTECSIKVVAISNRTCTNEYAKICLNSVITMERWAAENQLCDQCQRLVKDCWVNRSI